MTRSFDVPESLLKRAEELAREVADESCQSAKCSQVPSPRMNCRLAVYPSGRREP